MAIPVRKPPPPIRIGLHSGADPCAAARFRPPLFGSKTCGRPSPKEAMPDKNARRVNIRDSCWLVTKQGLTGWTGPQMIGAGRGHVHSITPSEIAPKGDRCKPHGFRYRP